MRTTIRLDENLLTAAKRYALETNRTLTAVIEDALRQHLNKKQVFQEREPVRLFTVHGEGVRPGVDLKDWSALLDLMDDSDGLF